VIAVDTSAIMAILYEEPHAARMRAGLERTDGALISAGNVLEMQIVISGNQSRTGWNHAEALLAKYNIVTHPFDARQLAIAREASIRFGKGRHKAGLNFGDCFAYALAKSEGIALLCTGNDFAETDVERV
jgi:ribonuclease VapC